MMTKMTARLPRVLWTALILAAVGLTAQAQDKIAVIDFTKVFDNYFKTKLINDQLQQDGSAKLKDLNAMYTDYQRATNDHAKALEEANNQAVAAEVRAKNRKLADAKLREIMDLEQTITQFRVRADTELDEVKRRKYQDLVTEIRTVVNAQAKAGGYGFVLDYAGKSYSGLPIVVYHNGQNDLTDTVLSKLNANAPPQTPK